MFVVENMVVENDNDAINSEKEKIKKYMLKFTMI
jgi:hypothetical protein